MYWLKSLIIPDHYLNGINLEEMKMLNFFMYKKNNNSKKKNFIKKIFLYINKK